MSDNSFLFQQVIYKKNSESFAFYYIENDLWIADFVLPQLYNWNPKKIKTVLANIRISAFREDLFQTRDIKEPGGRRWITFYNMNTALAVGYRIDRIEAEHLYGFYKRFIRKFDEARNVKLDPDITGMGRIYIQYGDMEDAIYNTDVYFRNTYMDEWFEDPFVIKLIKEIDRATVVDKGIINSYVLGKIPPTELSGGVKTLILLYKDHEHIYNVSTCGDNCAKWILKLAAMRNITINLRHIMDFGESAFDAVILNNGKNVHSMAELVQYAGYYV